MKTFSLSSRFRNKNLSDPSKRSLLSMPFFTFIMSMVVFLLFAGTSILSAQDPCDINDGWWDAKYLTLNSGIEDGDTVHIISCQDPWSISASDLKYYHYLKYELCRRSVLIKSAGPRSRVYGYGPCVKLKTFCSQVALPDNAPEGMYQLWKYEYVIEDVYCQRTYKKVYYLAMYDHGAPIYQCFPNDTTVASEAEIPPADKKVKIIDVCQYVAWDTIMMIPIFNADSSETIGYTRRWMARDPSGNESYKDQKILFGSSALISDSALRSFDSNRSKKNVDWKIYPNPARNVVYVDLITDEQIQYNVYDALGRSVKNGNYQQGQPIILDNLEAGVYHIQLRDQDRIRGMEKVLLIE